jgi:hypothetical protein
MSKQSKFYADSQSANENVVAWVERREKNISEMQKKNFFLKNFVKKIYLIFFRNFKDKSIYIYIYIFI